MLFRKNEIQAVLLPETFARLQGFVADRTGIVFGEHRKKLLEFRLHPRLRANRLGSFEEYVALLESKEHCKKELPALYDSVTSWDTRFFRHPEQFEALRTVVLPEILAARTGNVARNLTAWSAGCATGEEAYTLAIVLADERARLGGEWDAQVLGTDISESALAIARRGVYRALALREAPRDVVDRHFTRVDPDEYQVNEGLRACVQFRVLNLASRAMMSTMGGFDLIFCRNVLTYFGREHKQALLDRLYNALGFGGYLFVGRSESLHGLRIDLRPVQIGGTLAFRKE